MLITHVPILVPYRIRVEFDNQIGEAVQYAKTLSLLNRPKQYLEEFPIDKKQAERALGGPVACFMCGVKASPGYYKNHGIVLRSDLNGPDAHSKANWFPNEINLLFDTGNNIVDFIVNGPIIVAPLSLLEDIIGFEPPTKAA